MAEFDGVKDCVNITVQATGANAAGQVAIAGQVNGAMITGCGGSAILVRGFIWIDYVRADCEVHLFFPLYTDEFLFSKAGAMRWVGAKNIPPPFGPHTKIKNVKIKAHIHGSVNGTCVRVSETTLRVG